MNLLSVFWRRYEEYKRAGLPWGCPLYTGKRWAVSWMPGLWVWSIDVDYIHVTRNCGILMMFLGPMYVGVYRFKGEFAG